MTIIWSNKPRYKDLSDTVEMTDLREGIYGVKEKIATAREKQASQ
ncbi:hypothetical protein [Pedobacter agri]|nr:hypothetical protein [Pedobacter agri]